MYQNNGADNSRNHSRFSQSEIDGHQIIQTSVSVERHKKRALKVKSNQIYAQSKEMVVNHNSENRGIECK
jgi:hypothetical protein